MSTDQYAIGYENQEAVERLDTWYKITKEEEFFKYLKELAPDAFRGTFLEIGGGTGFQGVVASELIDGECIHTDYPKSTVERARQRGLKTQVMDGLHLEVEDGSLDTCFGVGPSTVVREPDLRIRQFKECHRVLKSGGYLILVIGKVSHKNGLHCLDDKDFRDLENCGFEIVKVVDWGIIPKRFWTLHNKKLLAAFEKFFAIFSLGVRRIMIARCREGRWI